MDIYNKVKSFLYCYYLCEKPNENFTKKTCDKVFNNLTNFDFAVDKMIERSHELFMKAVTLKSDKNNILPLSGGYDSRAILAGLLEQTESSKLNIVSYGTEGTYDYEIVKLLDKKLGLGVEFININSVEVTLDGLINTAKGGAHWTFLFDAFFRQPMYHHFGKESVYWSGYLAGEVAGSHVFKRKSQNWDQAIDRFISWNYYTKGLNLLPNDFDPRNILPKEPFLRSDKVPFHDQIDFYIRQCNYVEPVVIGNGHNHKVPFLDEGLMQFYFSIPYEYRYKRNLYRRWLGTKFKKLFDLPTQSDFGGGINRTNLEFRTRQVLNKARNVLRFPMPRSVWENFRIYESRNYIDFTKELEKESFKKLAHSLIHELDERKIIDWISIKKILKDHYNNVNDYTRAILLLMALEVHLKVEELNER